MSNPYSFDYDAMNDRLQAYMNKYKDLPDDAEITVTKAEFQSISIAIACGALLHSFKDVAEEAQEEMEDCLNTLEKSE